MIDVLLARWKQGHRTLPYPAKAPAMPDRFCGKPVLDRTQCDAGCDACIRQCPTQAIERAEGALRLDTGRCLFCRDCERACGQHALRFSGEFRLATRHRDDLVLPRTEPARVALDKSMRRLFGRSLKLRQVSAGGCNACEADTNVLNTVVFDLGRFGVQFVASPRHADGLLVTGPVTKNMEVALLKTYAAVPAPKLVIAVGACAISGGLFRGHAEGHDGVPALLPVDVYIPGCPPHSMTILDGILRALGKI